MQLGFALYDYQAGSSMVYNDNVANLLEFACHGLQARSTPVMFGLTKIEFGLTKISLVFLRLLHV